jgi:heptosyltransferase-3
VRILFITSNRIGDAVLSTGLLALLARTHPQARFTVACGAVAAPLFAPAPFVERVIPMVKKKRAGHWIDLWQATAFTLWHRVVDLRGSAMGWLVPTRHRNVLRSSWEPQHRLIHISSALGLKQPLAPQLWNTPGQETRAARLMGDGPILALGPTANWNPKQWPAERFAEAAKRLTGPDGILPGARVAVFGAEPERQAAQPVIDALPGCVDLVGHADLATVHACIKRASFYLGNDSGLMHIAAAAGTPTLGLFGPSSEVFYGPWGDKCASVRGPRSFEDICHAPGFDHKSQDCMMLDLEVDRVVAAARELWSRCG